MLLVPLKKHREHDPRLQTSEGRTDAVVDVTPERHVAAVPAENDLIRAFEHRGISGWRRPITAGPLRRPEYPRHRGVCLWD